MATLAPSHDSTCPTSRKCAPPVFAALGPGLCLAGLAVGFGAVVLPLQLGRLRPVKEQLTAKLWGSRDGTQNDRRTLGADRGTTRGAQGAPDQAGPRPRHPPQSAPRCLPAPSARSRSRRRRTARRPPRPGAAGLPPTRG